MGRGYRARRAAARGDGVALEEWVRDRRAAIARCSLSQAVAAGVALRDPLVQIQESAAAPPVSALGSASGSAPRYVTLHRVTDPQACELLRAAGWDPVDSVDGGTRVWRAWVS